MAVRKIGQSWWVDFRFGGVRYRKRSPHNTRSGAQEYEAAIRQRLARGEAVATRREALSAPNLFAHAATKWFDTYARANVKHSTATFYQKTLQNHLLPHFGTRRLESLTSFDVETFKTAKLKDGLAPASINSMLVVLKCMLNRAHEWGWLKRAPRTKSLKVPPQRFDFLTDEEAMRLLAASRGTKYHGMILAALRTGMRRSELLGLRWEDVDLERRIITVRRAIVLGRESSPKSNRERRIPITDDLAKELAANERRWELVFAGANGEPRSPHTSRHALHAACKKARLRRVGWHVLRHTFASQLAMKGAPLPAIQSLLGHASIQMTMRYSHITPATLREAIDLLRGNTDARSQSNGQSTVNVLEPRPSDLAGGDRESG